MPTEYMNTPARKNMQVLLLFAHADDESLAAGGLIQKLLAKGHQLQLRIVSDGLVGMRSQAADNRPALQAACGLLGITDVKCLGFKDQQFETYPMAQIANEIQQHIVPPDLIITHSAADLNQDHYIVHQVAKIIGRPRQRQCGILAGEIPCSAPWNHRPFQPQLYIDISAQLETKLRAFACYAHELRAFPDPFSVEGLRTLARFRGMESGYQAAEAFELIRWFEGMQV